MISIYKDFSSEGGEFNMRKVIIAVLTYFTIVIFFIFAGLPKPFTNSIVPTTGFMLSTLSLPYFKKLWIRMR